MYILFKIGSLLSYFIIWLLCFDSLTKGYPFFLSVFCIVHVIAYLSEHGSPKMAAHQELKRKYDRLREDYRGLESRYESALYNHHRNNKVSDSTPVIKVLTESN